MDNKIINNKVIMQGTGEKINKNFSNVLKGSIVAMIISCIFLTAYAILLTYTSISETTMIPVVITISGISILIGSSISSMKIKKQGMLNGALVGMIYMIAIYLLSSMCITGFTLNLQSIIMIIVGGIAGMIGGIIGVNL